MFDGGGLSISRGDLFLGLPSTGSQNQCLLGSTRCFLLTSSTATHETEIVEPSHLVLHDGGGVSQLCRIVLIVAGHDSHHCSIRHVPQCHHLKAGAGPQLRKVGGRPRKGGEGQSRAALLSPRRTADFSNASQMSCEKRLKIKKHPPHTQIKQTAR